jgi:hypothetical protein
LTRISLTAAVALMALAAGAGEAAEIDQIAQARMIGLSMKRLRACLGEPASKLKVHATQIWTYTQGTVWVEGGPLSLGVNGMASLFGNDRVCNINIVLTNAAVSQINYAAPDGGPLRLGEQCDFPVSACVDPPAVPAGY